MPDRPARVSTDQLLEELDDPRLRLIDVRPIDAYNGWRLGGEPRGGHIRGARTLPAKWAHYLEWIEIVPAKAIRPDHRLIVYGYDGCEKVARPSTGGSWAGPGSRCSTAGGSSGAETEETPSRRESPDRTVS